MFEGFLCKHVQQIALFFSESPTKKRGLSDFTGFSSPIPSTGASLVYQTCQRDDDHPHTNGCTIPEGISSTNTNKGGRNPPVILCFYP